MVEQGSHEELLRLRGRYHTLYRNQFVRDAEVRMLEETAAAGRVPAGSEPTAGGPGEREEEGAATR
jgi:hypothetical protein